VEAAGDLAFDVDPALERATELAAAGWNVGTLPVGIRQIAADAGD
jgi:hypothetical protein